MDAPERLVHLVRLESERLGQYLATLPPEAWTRPESRFVRITSCSHRFFMRKCCWTGKSGVISVSQLTKAEKAGHKAPVGRGPAARAPGSYGAGQ